METTSLYAFVLFFGFVIRSGPRTPTRPTHRLFVFFVGKSLGRFVTTLAGENQKGALHKPAGTTDGPKNTNL